jgi:acyl-CoA thioesterase I
MDCRHVFGAARIRCADASTPGVGQNERVRTYLIGSALVVGISVVVAGLFRTTLLAPERPRLLPSDRTQPVMYVALGDSTVAGVGATSSQRNYVSLIHERLREVYPGARLANLGVGGATAADVLAEQLARAVALHPALVTLSIGPNDITRGRTAEQFERDVETILTTLGRETEAAVVVNLIPDLAITPRFRGSEQETLVGRRAVAFNDALRRQSERYGASIVDLYVHSQKEVPARPDLVADDGYHPSDLGYARWAELMWEGIRTRVN